MMIPRLSPIRPVKFGAPIILTLVIANKNYSSWSFRPWILMRHFGLAFDEIVIPMAQENTRAEMSRFSPSGKCPSLHVGEIVVWDSLAIIEYVAELHPRMPIWPRPRAARAQARSLAAEMHSGFMGMRGLLPMNMRRKVKQRELTPEASADVARLEEAFEQARKEFGQAGAFLFGDFSAADAMFAPVVNRLHVYDVAVTSATRAYMDAMMALPAWQEWRAQAEAETWIIDKYEAA
jgi:glutathione S-transferase